MRSRGQRVDAVTLVVVLEPRSVAPFGLSGVQHHVHRQPVQPGAERALAAEEVQLLPRPHEHVLRQLLGARSVGDHAGAEREDPGHVLPVQPLEGATVPGGRERHVRIGCVGRRGAVIGSGKATAVIGRSGSPFMQLDGIPGRPEKV